MRKRSQIPRKNWFQSISNGTRNLFFSFGLCFNDITTLFCGLFRLDDDWYCGWLLSLCPVIVDAIALAFSLAWEDLVDDIYSEFRGGWGACSPYDWLSDSLYLLLEWFLGRWKLRFGGSVGCAASICLSDFIWFSTGNAMPIEEAMSKMVPWWWSLVQLSDSNIT